MSLLRHASTVALLTLASRVLGFARDAGVAALFGTGVVADASVAGLALPQIARRLLGEGALNAAILPALPEEEAQQRRRRVGALFLMFALASLLLAAVLFVFMPQVISVLAPGFADEEPRADGAVLVGRLTAICVPLAVMAGVLAAFANVSGRFARPAMAPAAANVAILLLLAALYLAGGQQMNASAALVWLAAGIVAGALVQFVLNLAAVPRGFISLAVTMGDVKAALPVLAAAVPTILAAALPQLRFIIAAAASSGLAGGVAALFYATRLVELPLGLVGASAGAVLLPALSGGDREKSGAGGIEAALALTLPAAVGLAVLAHPIVTVLFQRGAFDAQAANMTATALALLALTLPMQALEKVLVAIAFVNGRSRLVVAAGLAGLPVGAVVGFLTLEPLGLAGPALGVVASCLVGLVPLLVGLGRCRLIVVPAPARRRIFVLCLSAGAMGAAVMAGERMLAPILAHGGLAAASVLAGLIVLGMLVYAGLACALGGMGLSALRAGLRK